ncbi:hypothetical protein [Mucilaginibacter celer]|nr:hypothetical protein [Mucilaginibacter celer]
MNIFQKILGTVFPPYKFSVLRKERSKLFAAIISALPNQFSEIKIQTLSGRLYTLDDWKLFPDFKFVSMGYGGDVVFQYQKRGQNFKISGLQIFSKRNDRFEDVEILIQDNLVSGLKITCSEYQLNEFDLGKIKPDHVFKTSFEFPPGDIDLFYEKLDGDIKQMLNSNNLAEIDFNNRIYYSFYDLEDGNYLAVDKNLNVYSLVHDAKPMAKKLKNTFTEILSDLQSNKFDVERHLIERYNSGK